MSDVSQGPGWWEASDGKWYPPRESDEPPAPGWWLAADGKWYPPVDDAAPAPGWWLAADGKWYPPEDHPDHRGDATRDQAEVDRLADDIPPTPPSAPTHSPHSTAPSSLEPPAPPHAVERAPRTVAQAASDAMPVRRRSIDAADQIRIRNDASRQDAIAQAPSRFLAAARAVKALETELADTAAAAPAVAPGGAPPAPVADTAMAGSVPPPPPPPPAPPTLVGVPPAAAAAPAPLIELRTSPLGADIDHIGDRLLVFEDRVELRDRLDRVRQVLDGEEITDVVIQRKFTGAVLVVEAGNGESILTRGLRPEQAEQAKVLIHKRTRGGRPAAPREPTAQPAATPPPPSLPTVPDRSGAGPMPAPPPAPAPPPLAAAPDPAPEPAPGPAPAGAGGGDQSEAAAARMALLNRGRLNEGDLLRKLADLHRAGVLTDVEFEDKVALVGQLVAGESLAIG